MPEGFTQMFAKRLDESSALEVKEAQSGDLLLAGRVLICPGDRHIKVRKMEHGKIAILVDQPRVNGHRPSADVLFNSVAQEFGSNAIGVLMTGMGEDGAAGLGALQAAGAVTAAQSPDTCVVDSMPRAAIERGFASKIITLPNMATFLQATCSTERQQIEPAAANSPARNIAGEPSTSRR
jgi:two-component system chemotaxis response regulator CheB